MRNTLALKDAKTILKIPVLPISYADAKPLLEALGGPVAPDNWRGALPFTYHIGPGPAKVHLVVKSDWTQQAGLRRDRDAEGFDRIRISGSCAATITTAGCSARRIRSPAMSR